MAVDIGVESLTREQVVSVARNFETVALSEAVMARLERQRAAIDTLVESGTPVYGLSTGFGSLATTFISP
jgi:histidine ammonia-lyase